MKMYITPKRLLLFEEIYVVSKTNSKKLDLTSIKPQVEKLIEIKSKPVDVIESQSQIDKGAINTSPKDNKVIVCNEKIANEIEPDYIKPLSANIFETERSAEVHRILERQELNKVAKSLSDMHTNILG